MRTRKLEAIALVAALALAGAPWSACAQNRTLGLKGIGIELRCRIDDVDCEESPFPLETKTSDPTGIFGADLDIFPGRTLALRADIRYAIGFDDIRKASDVWSEIKNRAWQFSAGVGYRF